MARVYSYIRFSSKPQEQGDSLRRQKHLADKWLARHPEHVLDTSLTLRDLGKSAFRGANLDPKTGDLGKFIFLAEQGRIQRESILMLEHLDRFSRDEAWLALNVLTDLLKNGVRILTLDPERMIDRQTAGKMEVLLPAVLDLIIAHEQSQRKSDLVSKAWQEKRDKIKDEKLTRLTPAWLELSADRTRFNPIPDRVRIVKRIFRLACEGMGATAIVRRFNQENVPPFALRKNSGTWHTSYIRRILQSRAVLGEYQPCRRDRKPIGLPIPDYFPRIIDDATFYRAQDSIRSRRLAAGRTGDGVANLFTGLVRDARDGSTLTLIQRGKSCGKRLVSTAAQRGQQGSHYISFPYSLFEDAVLATIDRLDVADVTPDASEVISQRDELQGQLRDADERLKAVSARLLTDDRATPGFQTLMDVAAKIETKKGDLTRAIETATMQTTRDEQSALADTKDLHAIMRDATGDELADLRRRIKAQLRRLIKGIGVRLVLDRIGERSYRIMLARILFESGTARNVLIATPLRGQEYVGIDDEPLDLVKMRDKDLVARAEAIINNAVWDEPKTFKAKQKPKPRRHRKHRLLGVA